MEYTTPREQPRNSRRNGWQWPFHFLQVTSWFFVALFIATSWPLYFAFFDTVTSAILFVIYVISAIVCLFAGLTAATINAADPLCGGHVPKMLPGDVGSTPTVYCYGCNHDRKHTSVHCVECNKCVDEFDHHCFWLNTCVGKPNYRYFVMLLVSATVQVGLQFAAGLAILIHYLFVDTEDEFNTRVGDMHGCDVPGVDGTCAEPTVLVLGFVIGGGCVTLALGVLWGLLVHLLLFHLNLMRRGMTTYEYLKWQSRQRQQAQDKRLREQLEARRAAVTGSTTRPPSVGGSQASDDDSDDDSDTGVVFDTGRVPAVQRGGAGLGASDAEAGLGAARHSAEYGGYAATRVTGETKRRPDDAYVDEFKGGAPAVADVAGAPTSPDKAPGRGGDVVEAAPATNGSESGGDAHGRANAGSGSAESDSAADDVGVEPTLGAAAPDDGCDTTAAVAAGAAPTDAASDASSAAPGAQELDRRSSPVTATREPQGTALAAPLDAVGDDAEQASVGSEPDSVQPPPADFSE